ncbi:MAG: phosphatase PAP2 family protein [Dehalococcoidia bacterium]|nr:phosphatase PAP2 family protein [Dehalococcoidia bacterium]
MPEALNAVDTDLFMLMNGFVGTAPFIDRVAQWVVSDYLMPIALALMLIFMWFIDPDRELRVQRQLGVFVALASMALSNSVVFILNLFYFRPRPFVDNDVSLLFYEPTDSSFPSNAVAAVFGLAFGIWGVNRRLGYFALAAAILYGLARVYAGVHYPLDIFAGAAIAAPVTYLVFRLRDLLMPILMMAIRLARIFRLA